MIMKKKSIVSVTAAALIAQSVLVAGCVNTQEARIGPNDGTDSCYDYRVKLDQTRTFYNDDLLQGLLAVGAGAIVGVGVAVLTGNTSVASKVTGAVIGGLAGGFFNELVKTQGRENALNTATDGAVKERDNLKKTQAAMKELTDCRRKQVKEVRAEYKGKRISKSEGEARLAVIRNRMDRDYEIAQEINGNVQKRSDQFRVALNEVNGSGKGTKEKQFTSATSSALTVGQGIATSTRQMADARNDAGGLEAQAPIGLLTILFG